MPLESNGVGHLTRTYLIFSPPVLFFYSPFSILSLHLFASAHQPLFLSFSSLHSHSHQLHTSALLKLLSSSYCLICIMQTKTAKVWNSFTSFRA
ncbi:hypothetical protein RIF29_17016 [Crotalaria pallida]|uniref:Uncharacterized protein n=1 Tax=Crotalaria pallida TaxID=3830 RepID=A0AAN9IG25_CROPI